MPIHPRDLPLSPPNQLQSGLTLLETLLYLGLFGLIMGSIVTTSFLLTASEAKIKTAAELQTEATFIMDSLDKIFDDAEVTTPAINTDSTMIVSRSAAEETTTIQISAESLKVQRQGFRPFYLTRTDSVIERFRAEQSLEHQLTIEFRLNNHDFTFRKQLFTGLE